ncbi:hypothetical protein BH11MYX1_BH11MYX1_50900 [soil metagenome]
MFFGQAINTPFLLDDWFQLRYWRDHTFGGANLWAFARHNYLHYNPRIGEVWLAVVDGSYALHLIVTPLVQLGLLTFTFVVAFARWPKRTVGDLQLLLFLQTMIWVVVPIPGLMYFYRPYATNYLWGFATTLALCVPYRLALVDRGPRRIWAAPLMLVLGWLAGMCNEHTGPTAIVVVASFVVAAWRLRRLHAWMIAGLLGVIAGYLMLFFAPGQTARYGGIATHATPFNVLAARGVAGCVWIVREFLFETRLGSLMFLAVVIRYLLSTYRRVDPPSRRTWLEAGGLVAASAAILATLFFSPTTIDRMYFASGVLLAAAFTVLAEHMFREPVVRWLVGCACLAVFGYHVERFVTTLSEVKTENDERIAIMRAARPGSIVVVPTYTHPDRTRWLFGDDLAHFPWFREYVAGELFGLARVDLDRMEASPPVELTTTATYEPPQPAPALPAPTYRQLLDAKDPWALASAGAPRSLTHLTVEAHGAFVDSQRRPVIVFEGTPRAYVLVEGRPFDDARGHFIRVRDQSIPAHVETWYMLGCGERHGVRPLAEGSDSLLPVDERACRGPFTAIACEPDRCRIAGWY